MGGKLLLKICIVSVVNLIPNRLFSCSDPLALQKINIQGIFA